MKSQIAVGDQVRHRASGELWIAIGVENADGRTVVLCDKGDGRSVKFDSVALERLPTNADGEGSTAVKAPAEPLLLLGRPIDVNPDKPLFLLGRRI